MGRDTVVWINAKSSDKARRKGKEKYVNHTVTRVKLASRKKPVKRLRVLGYKKYKVYLRKRKR